MFKYSSKPARLHRKLSLIDRLKSVELGTYFSMINTLLLLIIICKVIL